MKRLHLISAISFVVVLLSCQNDQSEKSEGFQSVAADSISVEGFTGDSVKLVKTADIHFKVKDVEQSSRAVSALTRQYGGMVFNQQFDAAEGGRTEFKVSKDSLLLVTNYSPQSFLSVRVPAENLEQFLYAVADLGYYTGRSSLIVDDKSLEYLENGLKNKNRLEALAGAVPNVKTAELIQKIGIKDEAIKQQITNRGIDGDVRYSTVSMQLYQNTLVRKEMIANYSIADHSLPFSNRLSNALEDGWESFVSFLLLVARLWIFLLITLAILVGYRFVQNKKVRSLSPA